MKEAVNDVFKLVKNEGNLIFNFENAVVKLQIIIMLIKMI